MLRPTKEELFDLIPDKEGVIQKKNNFFSTTRRLVEQSIQENQHNFNVDIKVVINGNLCAGEMIKYKYKCL